jgi:hypothetical protein
MENQVIHWDDRIPEEVTPEPYRIANGDEIFISLPFESLTAQNVLATKSS